MEQTKNLLDGEIESEFDGLSELELGSNEHKVAVEGLCKLVNARVEIVKVESEVEAKQNSRNFEREKFESDKEEKARTRDFEREKFESDKEEKTLNRNLEKEKFESDKDERSHNRDQDRADAKKQNKFGWIFKTLEIAVPIVVLVVTTSTKVWGTNKTLRFEETGTVTTLAGRAHTNSLFSNK